MEDADVLAGITKALLVGAVTADVVAVEARLAGSKRVRPGWSQSDCHSGAKTEVVEHRVVSLTQRRLADPAAVIAGLPADTRPLPSVTGYDQLLKLPHPITKT